MINRILILTAVVIAAFILPGAVAKTQPLAETLTVDTLCYLGKGVAGEAGGAYFLPDGNIIVSWKDTPLIIDAKTGETIRSLEPCKSDMVGDAKVSKDGKRLVATKMGPFLVVWDVITGKILKNVENANGYCFSPDGTKLYIAGGNSSGLGAVRALDMNTLEEIERFGSFPSGFQIDISPDGQTLALSIYKTPDNEYDKLTNPVILINLNDKKNYTIVETFLSGVQSMEFSSDGKQIAFLFDGSGEKFIYIYDIVTKEKKRITNQQLSTLFGNISIAGIFEPRFIDDNNIYTGCDDLSGYKYYHFSWNLRENRIKNYIDIKYTRSIDFKDSIMLLCTQKGIIGFLNKNKVSVKDIDDLKVNYLAYHNNQIEFNSTKAFIGESMIYDTTGKLIANLGTQHFCIGKNIINVNLSIPTGVYILTINDKNNQLSYKFIVE